MRFLLLLLGFGLILSSCGGDDQQTASAETASYDVRGIYLATNVEQGTVQILHEEIPGLMNAMRMSLRLDSTDLTENFSRGDKISFRLARVGLQWYARDFEPLPDDTQLDLPEELTRDL